MSRPTDLSYNYSALTHNLSCVKKIAPRSKILAMLKGNAYGHGLMDAAAAFNVADGFGIVRAQTAKRLRDQGFENTLVLMAGFFSEDELPIISETQTDIVVHHWSQVEILENTKLAKPITVWPKVDTGMGRLGFSVEEFPEVVNRLLACSCVNDLPVLTTHFSDADNLQSNKTAKQIELFFNLTEKMPGLKSLANSAGVMAWPDSHADWVRPGIMLYGVTPFENNDIAHPLKPAMQLNSALVAKRFLKKDHTVGYGSAWQCPEDMWVGVVPIGYGDGYPRHAENGTPVLLNNKRVPLVGRVSMDVILVDLRSQPDAKVGDAVELWGETLSVSDVAQHANTISYELLCSVGEKGRLLRPV